MTGFIYIEIKYFIIVVQLKKGKMESVTEKSTLTDLHATFCYVNYY